MSKLLKKIIILVVVFVLIVAAFIMYNGNNKKTEEKKIAIGEPTLPVVSIQTEGQAGETLASGTQAASIDINPLFGYTNEMEAKYMRDSITPINSAGQFRIRVENYGNVIISAEYEVCLLSGTESVEKKQIESKDIVASDGYIDINICVADSISQDQEYLFILNLKTDNWEKIYYYTRIVKLTNNYCKDEIDFANNFSEATFDEDKANSIVSYLEPKSTKDNTNLGYVNINSSLKQIEWGNLQCEKVTQPVVTIKEILGDVGCIELRYKVKAKNTYDVEQYYNITEFFRIKWNKTDIYLLDYQRTMNQIFDNNNQSITTTRINLGISSSDKCIYKASENNKFIAFAKSNGLWLMDISENKVTELYQFDTPDGTDIRNATGNNSFQIASVSDDGDVKYIINGYMTRGAHEGKVGVALYTYDNKTNVEEEKVFIPFTKSYEILQQTVGKLTYINENNTMYIMLNDSIYSIDLTGNEYVQVVSNLTQANYSVNKKGNIIAWQVDLQAVAGNTLKILNFETGNENIINANPDEVVRVVGFVDDDFAYGIAKANQVVQDVNGNTTIPMYELQIINDSGEKVKTYSEQGYYFTNASVTSNMINLSRVKYAQDGTNLEAASDYQIFGNEEKETSVVKLATIKTDLKQVEYVINYIKKVTSSSKLEHNVPDEITVNTANSLSIREILSEQNKYYVYGHGKILNICDTMVSAITKADEVAGVVINEYGDYAWTRISKQTSKTLSSISIQNPAQENDAPGQIRSCLEAIFTVNGANVDMSTIDTSLGSIDILSQNLQGYSVYDLTGCKLDQILYYILNGQPIIAALDNNNYVLIVGYDFYNVVLLNPVTNQTYKKGISDASEIFTQYGNKFIGIKK